jgi:hypothetical protein
MDAPVEYGGAQLPFGKRVMDRPVVRGYDPSRGDFVAGAFSQYGMRTLFFGVDHKESRAHIEEYWLDGDDALEQLSNNCN